MDTVSQFITRLRNAGTARHEKVDVPSSKMRQAIAKILEENGLIRSFKVAKDSKQNIMRVYLKYDENGDHVITSIDKVSTPGRRLYVSADQIPAVRSGFGITILSTSKGVMSGKDAKQNNVGGELLCSLW